jgi:hypothetical protein
MPAISSAVRNFVRGRIGDTESGCNYWVGQYWTPEYHLDGRFCPQIDIERPGVNFFLGQISPQIIDSTGISQYPVCCIYTSMTDDAHLITPALFAGLVRIGVDWWESWPDESPPADPESSADAIEDAMYTAFNSEQYYGLLNDSGTSYNNEMTVTRGPLQLGGDNWYRLSRYSLVFRRIACG